MGWFTSSEEIDLDVKTIDSNGHVNNNIVIQEARDIHDQLDSSKHLLIATYFLCAIEFMKLALYVFKSFKKTLKKKYANNLPK